MEQGFISTEQIQVSYADTDMMGVIYHANYLKWFELGRSKLNKDIGIDYMDMERTGYCVPVHDLEITYKKAIHYGEQVFVKTWIIENLGLRTIYGYHVLNGAGDLCAEGRSTHIVVRKDDFKPVPLKKVFPHIYQKFESIKLRKESE